MANFYTDNPDLKLHLQHPLMRKIVALKSAISPMQRSLTMRRSISTTLWTTITECWKS